MDTAEFQRRQGAEAELLEEVRQALGAELVRSGFCNAPGMVPRDFQHGALRRDPYDGTEALYLEWRKADGQRCGSVIVHANGIAYAEIDVVRAHPSQRQWFVDCVTAWGRRGAVKAELSLLPALE